MTIDPVQAQTIPGELELGGGIRRVGAMSLGNADANLTNPGGGAFRLFTTESRLDGAAGLEARLAVRLSETLWLETSGSYGVSDLRTRISSDFEGIPDVSATEPIQQYTIAGALVMDLPRWRIGARTLPFVTAGGGYERHRHEDRALIESGGLWRVGGGANMVLRARPGASIKALGVRVDGGVALRRGGVAFDSGLHPSLSLGASAFARF